MRLRKGQRKICHSQCLKWPMQFSLISFMLSLLNITAIKMMHDIKTSSHSMNTVTLLKGTTIITVVIYWVLNGLTSHTIHIQCQYLIVKELLILKLEEKISY